MKTLLLSAAVLATLLSGCVLPGPPPLISVRQAPTERVYVEREPVYAPGYSVTTLSPGYRTMRRGRDVYYVDGDTYYRRNRGGYVVVNRPF